MSESRTSTSVTARYSLPQRIRRAAAEDLRECGKPRAEIAAGLTVATGRPVSLAVLEAMVAESKETHRLPLEMVPAWVEVTGSRRVLDLVAAELGLSLMTPEDMEFADYGRADLRRNRLARMLTERV